MLNPTDSICHIRLGDDELGSGIQVTEMCAMHEPSKNAGGFAFFLFFLQMRAEHNVDWLKARISKNHITASWNSGGCPVENTPTQLTDV